MRLAPTCASWVLEAAKVLASLMLVSLVSDWPLAIVCKRVQLPLDDPQPCCLGRGVCAHPNPVAVMRGGFVDLYSSPFRRWAWCIFVENLQAPWSCRYRLAARPLLTPFAARWWFLLLGGGLGCLLLLGGGVSSSQSPTAGCVGLGRQLRVSAAYRNQPGARFAQCTLYPRPFFKPRSERK